jgi:hypothetical protein
MLCLPLGLRAQDSIPPKIGVDDDVICVLLLREGEIELEHDAYSKHETPFVTLTESRGAARVAERHTVRPVKLASLRTRENVRARERASLGPATVS